MNMERRRHFSYVKKEVPDWKKTFFGRHQKISLAESTHVTHFNAGGNLFLANRHSFFNYFTFIKVLIT